MLYQLNSLSGKNDLFMDPSLNFYDDHLRKIHNVELRCSDGRVFKIDDFKKIESGGTLRKGEDDTMQKSYTNWRERNKVADQARPRKPLLWAGPGIDTETDGGKISDGAPDNLQVEIDHLQGVIDTGIDPSMDYGQLRFHLAQLKRRQIMQGIHSNPQRSLPGRK